MEDAPSFREFFGETYLTAVISKKLKELAAVYYFLVHEQKSTIDKNKFILNPEEPSDIVYDSIKFQVTTGSANTDAVFGILDKKEKATQGQTSGKWIRVGNIKSKSWETELNVEESLENSVLVPLRKKKLRYGVSEKEDLILLIYSSNSPIPPWNRNIWQDFRFNNKELLSSSGFKGIYLLDQKGCIRIFPV